jgi:hypothetical protein
MGAAAGRRRVPPQGLREGGGVARGPRFVSAGAGCVDGRRRGAAAHAPAEAARGRRRVGELGPVPQVC